MDEHEEVNWSTAAPGDGREELRNIGSQNEAYPFTTSERLSGTIDSDEVASTNTAESIRSFRDSRYGEEES